MKKLQPILPSLLLFLAQVPIAWALLYATLGAKNHWDEILGSRDEVSTFTFIAIRIGFAIPIIVAIISVVVGLIAVRNQSFFLWFLFITAVCEAVAIALLAFALISPSLKIMYRLGDREIPHESAPTKFNNR